MVAIDESSTQFDYFSGNYLQFEKDFYRYSKLQTPLTFLADDIIHFMKSNQTNFFRLNGKNAKDKRDHYFYFKVKMHEDNKQVVTYEYVGHRYYATIGVGYYE